VTTDRNACMTLIVRVLNVTWMDYVCHSRAWMES